VLLDASAASVIATARVDHAAAELKLGDKAQWLAVVESEGAHLTVVEIASGKAIRVPDATRVLSSSVAWSPKGELCWASGGRPTSDDSTAELWCWADGAARQVTRATWPRDATSSVWAGFPAASRRSAVAT
jgi:hypothetical protein